MLHHSLTSLTLCFRGLVWGMGTVLGPAVGGGFELYTWRWAFYINLLFGAFLLPAYVFLIPSTPPTTGLSVGKRASTFDVVGAVISIAAFTVLIVAINFGGALYAWNSGVIIALFVVGGLLWIGFAFQQSLGIFTSPENRMFPVHLLKMKDPILLFIIGCCVGTISYVSVYYIPLYFQFTRGDSAIQAAVRLLPFIFMLIVFMLGSGFFLSKFGLFTPWYLGGSALSLIGAVLMCKCA
jgi:MFS family permease